MSKFVYVLREYRETLDYEPIKDDILIFSSLTPAVEEYGRRLHALSRRKPVSRIDAHLYVHLVTADERVTIYVKRKRLRG